MEYQFKTEHFNGLTPAEAERLALLIEEAAEVQQIATKILRHGYESVNPVEQAPTDLDPMTNRELLHKELGHLSFATQLMMVSRDPSPHIIANAARRKAKTVWQWLHHQDQNKFEETAIEPK